jgi:hypothetical protein
VSDGHGVVDTLLDGLETSAGFALVTSYGGYTTNPWQEQRFWVD